MSSRQKEIEGAVCTLLNYDGISASELLTILRNLFHDFSLNYIAARGESGRGVGFYDDVITELQTIQMMIETLETCETLDTLEAKEKAKTATV